ncbi:hypothetical protein Y1Q_0015421 [Alligator mississippiensis]|uniref:Uncharacterized protein n=1 Tax=Alligator mississippiensis TaxID=8496 RepID=A0A151NDC3_ALLMI|nr:hypothetical protein Y1Q_0015421 [Alligator mississippiensis]
MVCKRGGGTLNPAQRGREWGRVEPNIHTYWRLLQAHSSCWRISEKEEGKGEKEAPGPQFPKWSDVDVD